MAEALGEAGDSHEGEGDENNGGSDEFHAAVAEVFEDKFDGDQRDGHVGDAEHGGLAPARAGER
jgi:hypothetical protein